MATAISSGPNLPASSRESERGHIWAVKANSRRSFTAAEASEPPLRVVGCYNGGFVCVDKVGVLVRNTVYGDLTPLSSFIQTCLLADLQRSTTSKSAHHNEGRFRSITMVRSLKALGFL